MAKINRNGKRKLRRERREQELLREMKKERERSAKRMLAYAAVIVVIVVGLGFGLDSYTGYMTSQPSSYDSLAECLTDSGAEMYGAYSCTACQRQKAIFGSSFQDINYIECDPSRPGANPQLCRDKGITAYPTWIINGQKYVGILSMEKLAEFTGC